MCDTKKEQKKNKSILLQCFLLIVLGMIIVMSCGCGPELKTQLSLSEEFAGERIMSIDLTQDEMKEWLSVDYTTLDSILKKTCPKQLQYSSNKEGETYKFQYSLTFESKQDYEDKVQKLSGKKPQIEMECPNTPFASGVYYKEDIDSLHLMNWLPELLVENQCIKKGNSSYVLNNSSTVLYYDGKEYPSWESGSVRVEAIKKMKITDVSLFTDVENETIGRTIQITMPGSSYSLKTDEVDSYLKEHLPETATSEWQEAEEGNYVYSIVIPNMSFDEFEKAMKVFTGSDSYQIKYENQNSSYYFTLRKKVYENIDLTAYLSDDMEHVNSSFYIKDSFSDYKITKTGKDGTIDCQLSLDAKNPHYHLIGHFTDIQLSYEAFLDDVYMPSKITVSDSLDTKKNLTRKVVFFFEQEMSTEEQAVLSQVFRDNLSEQDKFEAETNRKGTFYRLEGSEKGSSFGTGPLSFLGKSMTFNLLQENNILQTQLPYQVDMQLDFSKCFSGNCPVSYEFHYPGAINESSVVTASGVNLELQIGKISIESETSQIKLGFHGYIFQWQALVAVIAIILVFIGIIFLMVKYKKNRRIPKETRRFKKNKKTTKSTTSNTDNNTTFRKDESSMEEKKDLTEEIQEEPIEVLYGDVIEKNSLTNR